MLLIQTPSFPSHVFTHVKRLFNCNEVLLHSFMLTVLMNSKMKCQYRFFNGVVVVVVVVVCGFVFQMVTHYIGHIIPEQAGHAG